MIFTVFVVLNTVQAQKKSALGGLMSKLMAIFSRAKISVREARAGNIKYFIIGMPKGAAGRVVNSNNI